MMKEFTIDNVSWHLRTPGNPESLEHIIARFYAVVSFLQDNGLTTRQLLRSKIDITENFSIKSTDLTDIGLELMKKNYEKWLSRVDKGADPKDVSQLEKALAKLKKDFPVKNSD